MKSQLAIRLSFLALLGLSLAPLRAVPADPGSRKVIVPDTTVEQPDDAGQRAHTNHLILAQPSGGLGPAGGMAPWQLRSFYNVPAAGSGVIAIVDAYHYPSALNDFNAFSKQFGLPVEPSTNALAASNSVFQVVYASGRQPKTNGGWSQEAALDIEWAHALAPGARIVLVEASSASFSDLLAAVDKAAALPGVVEISMSWGGSEFSGEASYDGHFQHSGVVYFASSGDSGGVVEYPSCSPFVVSVGGTSVATDANGQFLGETGWSGSGGGVSQYETRPTYQSSLAAARRAVPDIAADADPNTGVSVYDSTAYHGMSGWMVFGGTSVASPCMAAMTNAAGHTSATSGQELTKIYGNLTSSAYSTIYRDITAGTAGSFQCGPGWDAVTGVGSPLGTTGL